MRLQSLVALSVLTSISYAGGNYMKPVDPVIAIPIQEVQPVKDNDYFIYVGGGLSDLKVNKKTDNCLCSKPGALDSEGELVEIGVGYRYSENIFVTLAAQRTMLDIVDIDNVYASLNYQFDTVANPYIGVLAGYSRLKWNEYPAIHNASFVDDLESTGLMYGVQLGIEPQLTENWSLFAKYQFIKYEHLMKIRPNSSSGEEIEHEHGQNVLTGVRYGF